jgi:adenine-specific DNA-methyltransferase
MPHERLKPTFTFTEDRVRELKKIAPEAFGDGKIDWDSLREALGENLEEEGKEHYVFNWPGKRGAKKIAVKSPQGTLIPVKGDGVNEDTTGNIFIEGDNLEVLKLLQKSYASKIKVIYIDPPYNTGNDFIYKDNYQQPLEEYLKITGQIDVEGVAQTTNKRAYGRFHTNWLNMMYPRLSLARNLLRHDGVMFVSIDDNEMCNLKKICDEIFGEENYVGNVTWEKRTKCQNTETARNQLQSKVEYILVYKKQAEKLNFNLEITGEKKYELHDDKGAYREKIVEEMSAVGMRGRQTMIYPIKGVLPREGKQWKIGCDQAKTFEDRGDVIKRDGRIYLKIRPEDENGEQYAPFWSHFFDKDTYGTAETGKAELSDLLGTDAHGFETVKPVALISKLLFHVKTTNGVALDDNDIVLDFFAGSATTAHAIYKLNKQVVGNCKFILIQIPELCPEDGETFKAGYKTISELGKERIRRVIKKMEKEALLHKSNMPDMGFKVFKLASSHFKAWRDYTGNDLFELTSKLEEAKDPLSVGWKKNDLLTEIILQKGFPLDSKIERVFDNQSNDMISISSAFCEHKLFVCLDKRIEKETISRLSLNDKDVFICLDSALTDEQKLRLSDKGFLATI